MNMTHSSSWQRFQIFLLLFSPSSLSFSLPLYHSSDFSPSDPERLRAEHSAAQRRAHSKPPPERPGASKAQSGHTHGGEFDKPGD
ncbi:hypothetical protein VZT92_009008 [Zoarces viviparus]|uniref:Secreted protein n=1 Tax=Zoarces viviparus TaxID=48416 RepID=A0AAW1FH57_ZOAVI